MCCLFYISLGLFFNLFKKFLGKAINKEQASRRTYMQLRKLNQLRYNAHKLLCKEVINTKFMSKLEQRIDDGLILVLNLIVLAFNFFFQWYLLTI